MNVDKNLRHLQSMCCRLVDPLDLTAEGGQNRFARRYIKRSGKTN